MKKTTIITSLLFLCVITNGSMAAIFVNLDFESYIGTGDDLLPGWECSVGGEENLWPLLDMYPLTSSGIGLVSADARPGMGAINGEYSLFLSVGLGGQWEEPTPVSVWQTAIVPLDAIEMSFTINGIFETYKYDFYLGTENLLLNTPTILSDGNLRYTADISALAGQETTLSFTIEPTFSTPNDALGAWHQIDDIQFTAIVPEPSITALGLIGLGSLLWRSRKRRRQLLV